MTFNVTASASADALVSLYLLSLALNYWASNDVAYFAFYVLV